MKMDGSLPDNKAVDLVLEIPGSYFDCLPILMGYRLVRGRRAIHDVVGRNCERGVSVVGPA